MRTRQRLLGLRAFIEQQICKGREMKAPADDYDVTKVVMQEPRCYLAWAPMREENAAWTEDQLNVCPGIIVMPMQSNAQLVEEKRFDRYNSIHRGQEMGQTLGVQILFSVYEPGIRLPGVMDEGEEGRVEPERILDGTQEGLFTLTDWMDELMEALLRERHIPGTDLFLDRTTMTYSLYNNSDGVVDKRPIYYGYLTAQFYGYAESNGLNGTIDGILN